MFKLVELQQLHLSPLLVSPKVDSRDAHGIPQKFIYETGRTFSIPQYDKEPSLKALTTGTMKKIGERV